MPLHLKGFILWILGTVPRQHRNTCHLRLCPWGLRLLMGLSRLRLAPYDLRIDSLSHSSTAALLCRLPLPGGSPPARRTRLRHREHRGVEFFICREAPANEKGLASGRSTEVCQFRPELAVVSAGAFKSINSVYSAVPEGQEPFSPIVISRLGKRHSTLCPLCLVKMLAHSLRTLRLCGEKWFAYERNQDFYTVDGDSAGRAHENS